MRVCLVAFALALSGLATPAEAQPQRPGPRVTITQGVQPPPPQVTSRDYELSPRFASPFRSSSMEGVVGFQRYPLPGPFDLPGVRPLVVDFR
jgi:hypothetical protein